MTNLLSSATEDAIRALLYQAALDAVLLHRVGHEDDIVAQLAVGSAQFCRIRQPR